MLHRFRLSRQLHSQFKVKIQDQSWSKTLQKHPKIILFSCQIWLKFQLKIFWAFFKKNFTQQTKMNDSDTIQWFVTQN